MIKRPERLIRIVVASLVAEVAKDIGVHLEVLQLGDQSGSLLAFLVLKREGNLVTLARLVLDHLPAAQLLVVDALARGCVDS